MPKLMAVEKWIEQINGTIDRLSDVDCPDCLPKFMDGILLNKVISSWEYSEGGIHIIYWIDGQEVIKEL